ncbi:IS5/IS1182 family transposase [Aphis craccivora]|uniref:IS5/IS1182 family transposase n=1 Tax=Aphis craccivora TaxID=307492 RepID=A0A6G0XTD4_APHCR|nr:IS5/IS1182 family transposase [Aphis craccivora]
MWKKKVGYHRRSVAETAMFRIKTLLGGHLRLHDYEAQRQDRITGVAEGAILSANSDLFNKAPNM